MRKIAILNVFLCFSFFIVQGQGQYDNWCMTNGKSINFNNGVLSTFSNGNPLAHAETCATISDANGNLLFYSIQSGTIYDKNHQAMPNGNNLEIISDAQQGVLIVPHPGNESIYYLFHLGDDLTRYKLFYSVIDMSLRSGLGDVTQKNIELMPGARFDEKLTATHKFNREEFWMIAHDAVSNEFYSFTINQNGIQSAPVISASGINSNNDWAGELAISHNECYIAQTMRGGWGGVKTVEVMEFDNKTGEIGNVIFSVEHNSVWGVEFSPDDSKIYVTANHSSQAVYQYDLNAGNAQDIINSKTAISPVTISFSIETGPDDKIYLSTYNFSWGSHQLSVINNPNAPAASCDFVTNAYPSLGPIDVELPNNFNLISRVQFCNEPDSTIIGGGGNGNGNDSSIYDYCNIVFPNAFTPNGDGNNDQFGLVYQENIDFKNLLIYNRWGQQVFSSINIAKHWDGKIEGEYTNADVYFYICEYECTITGKRKYKRGDITLLR